MPNSARQVGGSLGIAITGAIVAHVSASSLAAGNTRPAVVAAVTMVGTGSSSRPRPEEPAFQAAA